MLEPLEFYKEEPTNAECVNLPSQFCPKCLPVEYSERSARHRNDKDPE